MLTDKLTDRTISSIPPAEAHSLNAQVEQYTGQSLGQRVEASIGQFGEAGPGRKTFSAVTASDLLRYLMIPGTCQGFRLLETAVELAVEDEDRLLNVLEDLYPLVAERHNTTISCVQKNMRMAIIVGWKNGGGRQLEKLIGIHYQKRPVTKNFIDLLADYLRQRELPRETVPGFPEYAAPHEADPA